CYALKGRGFQSCRFPTSICHPERSRGKQFRRRKQSAGPSTALNDSRCESFSSARDDRYQGIAYCSAGSAAPPKNKILLRPATQVETAHLANETAASLPPRPTPARREPQS